MRDSSATLVFRAMMLVWVVVALAGARFTSQDGAGFVAAGQQVVAGEVALVYAGPAQRFAITEPATRARICEHDDADTLCESYARFLSTPAAVPLVAPFGLFSLTTGIQLWRLSILASLIWGMWVLRERAEGVPRGPLLMAISAVLMTPAVHFLVGMGQTSGSMFLAAALGVTGASTAGIKRVGAVLATTVAVVTKITPVLTLVPLALLGARKAAAAVCATVAGLAIVATVIGGASIWTDYVDLSSGVADTTASSPLSARLSQWLPIPVLGVLVVAFAAVLVVRRRSLSADALLGGAWLIAVSVSPFLWNHYLWVCLAVLVIVYTDRATVFAFVATLVFVSGSAVIHIGGSPEGEPWWRAAVVVLTAVVLVHSAVTGASRAAPSRAALRVEGA